MEINNIKEKEDLNALKEEVETLNKKLHELTDEELAQVTGGADLNIDDTDAINDPSGVQPMPSMGWFGIPRPE